VNRREETYAVKRALTRAGIQFRHVGHERGTACEWLKIKLMPGTPRSVEDEAIRVAQTVTGRHGEYDGRIVSRVVIV